jgi:hypothetical protein
MGVNRLLPVFCSDCWVPDGEAHTQGTAHRIQRCVNCLIRHSRTKHQLCVTDADDFANTLCCCAGTRDFKTFKKFVDEHKAKLLTV